MDNYLHKAVEKQSNSLSLIAMKMKKLPDISMHAPALQCLTNLNLSKNNLFNGEELFEVSISAIVQCNQLPSVLHKLTKTVHLLSLYHQALCSLEQLTELNLSENFLNGALSEHAGRLMHLEVINMDINNVTMLCAGVKNWTKLKIFTISDNSLTGKELFCCN